MKIHIRDLESREIVHSVDVTGKGESARHKVFMGMMRRVDLDRFFVDDTECEESLEPPNEPGANLMGHSRYYIIKDGRRVQVPSVTTILGNLSKGRGFDNWLFKQGQQSVFDGLDAIVKKSLEEAAERGGDEVKMPASRILQVFPPIADNQWQMTTTAADIGTITHDMVECDLKGLEFVPSVYRAADLEVAQQLYQGWLTWKRQHEFELVACELELTSTPMEYGGRLDFSAAMTRLDGALNMSDLKTSKKFYFENLAQVCAYGALWEEHNPDQPIEYYSVLRLSKVDGAVEYKQYHRDSRGVRDAQALFAHARMVHAIRRRNS